LRTAAAELNEAIERGTPVDKEVWTSDPHKGKFGGQAATRQAAVRLESFEEQPGIEFLALNLLVEGEAVKGPVTFYLHPTLSPSIQRVFASEGTARVTCYSQGAFTLGVQLADGTQLELDLSQLPKLPKWFRSR
jgi:hypothetical protein